jgi:diadenosine tetraphosphate (Ap4A) HIT family hydrolase
MIRPFNEGHGLLVPRKHLISVDELFDRFEFSLVPALRDLCKIVREKHRPDGLTIGFNAGAAAGQTIKHVHCHVIPR